MLPAVNLLLSDVSGGTVLLVIVAIVVVAIIVAISMGKGK
jgi:hypothetical protein